MKINIPIEGVDREYLSQLQYALTFASEHVSSCEIDLEKSTIIADASESCDVEEVTRKIEDLVQRYKNREFGLVRSVHYENNRDLPVIDAWSELLKREWVTQVGEGHVILRGPAAKLMKLIDRRVDRLFAKEFEAELEVYPSTIKCETLDRVHHFTSFPEHVDFVSHLKSDVDVLGEFSKACGETGWKPEYHEKKMGSVDFAISPSCCYHCYEGREGWRIAGAGAAVTATLGCHRFEGANHQSLTRLRAFTMREVIFVGTPAYVIGCRAKAEELIIQWAKDWELVGSFETANDMFFTDDYAVKASFQRQQQAKKELLLRIPSENRSISVFSSNFHAVTFGKAFDIRVGNRPATTGCLGWGYERWIYAIFSQFGLDCENWPKALRDEYLSLD